MMHVMQLRVNSLNSLIALFSHTVFLPSVFVLSLYNNYICGKMMMDMDS